MTKISAYTALTLPSSSDVLPIVDTSDTSMAASGTTKKITVATLAPVDWLNAATQFGADPAGTADSTTAIQNALNAAPQGQPVYLPYGTYKTTSPLTLPAGSVLLGDSAWDVAGFGAAGTVIKPSAAFTGTEVLYMTDTGSARTLGSVIRNIAIDGSALAVTADGIRAFGPVVKTVIENVTISSCTGWGINQLTDAGVASGNTCPYSWRVTHVLADTCAAGGFNLPGHTDSTWADVETLGSGGTSGHGFAITGAPSNSHFTNCRAEWTGTGDGFHLTGTWNTGTASGGFTMTGCSTDRNQQNGFYCNATGTTPVIVTNCTLRRDGRNSKTGAGSYAGIQLSAASIPLFFSLVSVFPGADDDGTGTNSPQYGVSFTGSTFAQILSGYIQGNTAGVNGTVSGSQLIAPNVIVASGSTGGPSTQLTDLYRQASGIIQTDNAIQVPSSFVSAQRFTANGITGATAASRYVGATTSGAPVSGTFSTGDHVVDQAGKIWICTAGGTPGTWVSLMPRTAPAGAAPSGAIAQTIPPFMAGTSTIAVASGTLQLYAIELQAGQVVSNITFLIGTTAGATLTHGWFALLNSAFLQVAHSADQTSGGLTASAFTTKAMTTPYTAPSAGQYWAGIAVVGGTQPTLGGYATSQGGAAFAAFPAAGPSTTGLTGPGTDGSTSYIAPSATANAAYAYTS